ncbi:MAG: ribosome maturation factor RimM [Arsenophonus sp.]|nr:MAG: ribosome maturation factor RimM [Arsenophonus sp.]
MFNNVNHENLIVLGKICSPYGVKGWIKIFSYSQIKSNIFNYSPWYIKELNKWKKIFVKNWQCYKKNFIFKIDYINDRDMAKRICNSYIFVKKKQLPILPLDEFYWFNILDCQVINIDGKLLGYVKDIIETGSNDVLIVRNSNHKLNEFLIPFILKKVIRRIDTFNKVIYVTWNQ